MLLLFGQLVSILVSWTVGRLFGVFLGVFLVGCLVGFAWLVGWFGFILVLVDCSPDRTTIISLLVFTELKSSADHNGWQPGCKWTSQFWNVTHCLWALDRGQWTFTYDISQLLRNVICFHSWIDKLLIFLVILVWQLVEKKFYKLLSRSVFVIYICLYIVWNTKRFVKWYMIKGKSTLSTHCNLVMQ